MEYKVQVGKGKGKYTTKYTFNKEGQAVLWFNSLNTHSGHKKRLVDSEGKVIARVIT